MGRIKKQDLEPKEPLEIFLFNEFGHNIITRRCMQDFFEKISKHKEDKLVLNFSKIEFISRTCADEYIKSKNSSLKNITESNLNKNVSDMLSVITHISSWSFINERHLSQNKKVGVHQPNFKEK